MQISCMYLESLSSCVKLVSRLVTTISAVSDGNLIEKSQYVVSQDFIIVIYYNEKTRYS